MREPLPIRILYLTDEFKTARAGSEQNILWLLRNIPGPAFEKYFVVFSYVFEKNNAVFPVRPLVLTEEYGKGKRTWFGRLFALARYLRKHRIDLIQVYSPSGELVALLASLLAGRGRIIGNRRDCGYHLNRHSRTIYGLMRLFRTRYLANSEAAREAAHQTDGTPLERISVIRNPIATDRMSTGLADPVPRSDLLIPEESDGRPVRIIGMVATVRPIKDHATLLRAAKRVLEKHPETWFLMVGEQDPVHLASLRHLAADCHVDGRIVWFGGLDNPVRILPHVHIGVLASHSESFSNAVLEYSAVGLPVVVSRLGGLGEIVVDGKTGFLVPPGDEAALADRLIDLLDDPERCRCFGAAGKAFVEECFSEEVVLKQYMNYYEKVLLEQ